MTRPGAFSITGANLFKEFENVKEEGWWCKDRELHSIRWHSHHIKRRNHLDTSPRVTNAIQGDDAAIKTHLEQRSHLAGTALGEGGFHRTRCFRSLALTLTLAPTAGRVSGAPCRDFHVLIRCAAIGARGLQLFIDDATFIISSLPCADAYDLTHLWPRSSRCTSQTTSTRYSFPP